jgi:hypothetical protein
MGTKTAIQKPPAAHSQKRFAFGILLFACGRLTFLLIPLVRGSSLTSDWKNVLSVICVFGLPDLFTVLAVAVLGKEGFAQLKQLLFSRIKRFAPPAKVGKVRYRIGLVMFFVPIVFGWAYPYLNEIFSGFQDYRIVLSVCGDLLLVTSFFVLGGEFWDKIRGLFVHEPAMPEISV